MPTPSLNSDMLDKIADTLQLQGHVLLSAFLPKSLANQLYLEAKTLSTHTFTPAGIGRDDALQLNKQIRTDSTLWLSDKSSVQQTYLDCMEALRLALNRRLFMGLNDFECHFSHYKQGQFYKKHLDAFKRDPTDKRSHRVLSTVYYLNPNWQAGDGGELLLYNKTDPEPILTVPPIFNSCILFLSDTFPHQVLASQADRYSIAGWYRVKG